MTTFFTFCLNNIFVSSRKTEIPQYQDLFYRYLVTNLKLYFDRFEDELASVLPEPTTSEYEDEKEEQSEEPEEGGEDLDLGGEEEDLEL